MSVIGSNILAGASGQGGDYTIARSLRFRSSASAYLNRTPASAGNQKTWTFSAWVKRGILTTSQDIFSVGNTVIRFGNGTTDNFWLNLRGNGSTNYFFKTTAVLRDPSAWYHIIIAADTTQATSSNRVKIYVNGVQVTDFTDYQVYPPQNTDLGVNSTSQHTLGCFSGVDTFFDGYLAEVNLIDGQQLTPSSFGATNASTGVWQPKKYAGTYGTNGFYLPFTGAGTASYAGSFNGSNQWLNGSLTSAIGSGDFTVEGWVYQNTLTNYQTWLSIERGAGGFNIGTDAAGSLTFYSSSAPQISVSGVIKAGTWQHIAFVRSGSTLTAYHNGVSKGTATVTTNFSATAFYIGALNSVPQELLNASFSNLRITGTAVYTSNFTPPTQALTAISGTRLLTLQSSTIVDNSGNSISITNNNSVTTVVSNPFLGTNIASDQSGSGNNWTTNNISLTAGSTYDSMTDVPTLTSATAANYAVLNAISQQPANTWATSNGNLNLSQSYQGAPSTIAMSSGKWYWEVTGLTNTSSNNLRVGIAPQGYTVGTSTVGDLAGSYAYSSNGYRGSGGTYVLYGTTYTDNDVIGVAFDADAGTLTFYKNGTSQGQAYSGISGTFFALTGSGSSSTMTLVYNFGQRPFAYTPPTGFVALNTFNLPTPTIGATATTLAEKYMDISLYSGTSASGNNITDGLSLSSGGLLWVKNRNATGNHALVDSVRGITKRLISDSTNAEDTISAVTSFNSNGFTLNGSDGSFNLSGRTYVAWQWLANGTGVSNTDGSITSTVSANTSAGFSVVTYTGAGSGGAYTGTIGHGLGVAPRMVIVKNRGTAGELWDTYHASLGPTQLLILNSTSATQTYSAWKDTAPTSTVFTVSADSGVGQTGQNYVAYCFSAIAGYSAFTSYTGNGSSDGSFIYLGFRPRFIMIKRTDSVGHWIMYDTARDTYNITQNSLRANVSDAENQSYGQYDILSNGFKIRTTDIGTNASGGSYVVAAFAENPFKYSLAR